MFALSTGMDLGLGFIQDDHAEEQSSQCKENYYMGEKLYSTFHHCQTNTSVRTGELSIEGKDAHILQYKTQFQIHF